MREYKCPDCGYRFEDDSYSLFVYCPECGEELKEIIECPICHEEAYKDEFSHSECVKEYVRKNSNLVLVNVLKDYPGNFYSELNEETNCKIGIYDLFRQAIENNVTEELINCFIVWLLSDTDWMLDNADWIFKKREKNETI